MQKSTHKCGKVHKEGKEVIHPDKLAKIISVGSELSEISGSHDGRFKDGCLLGFAPCSLVEVYQRPGSSGSKHL
jgi:hypothetical protein